MSYYDEFIKWIMKDNNALQILGFVITVCVAILTATLTAKKEKARSTKEYFKQRGIDIQKQMLDFWSSILMYDYKYTVEKYKIIYKCSDDITLMKHVLHDSFSYSSKSTTKSIAEYMHFTYKGKKSTTVMLVLVARIISLMKHDFTGERTSVVDIFKLKLNDLSIWIILKIYFVLFYFKMKSILLYIIFFLLLFLIIQFIF